MSETEAERKNRLAMRETLLGFQEKITALEQKVIEGSRTIATMKAELDKVQKDHIMFRLKHTGNGPTA